MRFEIRRRNVKVSEKLRTRLRDRLRQSLGRYSRHIGMVRVYLRDHNGARGSLEKKCRIVIDLPPRGSVIVSGVDADIRAALAATVSRAGLAVKRHVNRRRTRRRPPRRRAPALALAGIG
jgi:ribosome-associated translation inhibitor RaiA